MKKRYSIGVDIGGTNTDIGLVDRQGNCIAKNSLKTSQYYDPQIFVNDLVAKIHTLLKQFDVLQLTGIGVGAPCANYYDGSIDYASNLNFKGRVFIREMIQKQLNFPVVITNDANAAAYGEMIYGGAKGMKHFIMITLGTGMGSGIVIDGKILHGYNGFAGELGHCVIIPEGRSCACGNKGCIERYVSHHGITQTCMELLHQNPSNELAQRSAGILNCKTIAEAANAGNPVAIETFNRTGYWLGIALANAVNFSAPEAIFLMGGPVRSGEILLKPLRESFEKHRLFLYNYPLPILVSSLKENDAAILGAAALTKVNDGNFS